MRWIRVFIPAAPDTLEDCQAALVALGVDSFQIEDERDVLAGSPQWDMTDDALLDYYRGLCRLVVYLPDAPDGLETLDALRRRFDGVAVEHVDEEDWAENWKRYYRPFPVGERLLVQPAWLETDNPDGRAVFLNNPGMTFGTGLHASTRLCLELLERRLSEGAAVLDIGCGSGILSICALLLGARRAVAVDIDPLSESVARDNAAANGVTLETLCGDFLKDAPLREKVGGPFDVVLSNIVADVIIALSPLVGTLLAPGGVWISSGIIEERLPDVLPALGAAGFAVQDETVSGGWAALTARAAGG